MVWSFWSTLPLQIDSRHLWTSSSSFSHSLLLAAGHFTLQCSNFLLDEGTCVAWGFQVLWGDSRPGSSSISPGSAVGATRTVTPAAVPQGCFTWSFLRQAILAFRFLETLPQIQTALVFLCPFTWVIAGSSVRLGCSSSPPLKHPCRYISVGFFVA